MNDVFFKSSTKIYLRILWTQVRLGRSHGVATAVGYDMWKEASMPKTSAIRPVVSIQHRLVTDRQTDVGTDGGHGQTDRHATTAYTALA